MSFFLSLIFTICSCGFALWYARLGRLKKITLERARFYAITNAVMALLMVTIFAEAAAGEESYWFYTLFAGAIFTMLLNIFNLARGNDPL